MITKAYAQDAATSGESLFQVFFPLVLIFGVFYFLLIRPQQQKMKRHRAMLDGIQRNDKVVTGGGIIGRVVESKDDTLTLRIANDVEISVLRSTISHRHETSEASSKSQPGKTSPGKSPPGKTSTGKTLIGKSSQSADDSKRSQRKKRR